MTQIRETLENLASQIEAIDNKPSPAPQINDRSVSGNKIHGGMITQFSSVGIIDDIVRHDKTKGHILRVSEDGIHVNVVHTKVIPNPLEVKGNLTVGGSITATSLHVDELTADVRQERTSPLEFRSDDGGVGFGKGLIWPGGNYTKQFTLQSKPEAFLSTESINLSNDKSFMIAGENVLSQNELGIGVVRSNLTTVGVLEELAVSGPLAVDNYLYYDANSERVGLGTSEPNGSFAIKSWDHEFIIDSTEDKQFKLGTYTTSGLKIITDDTSRLEVAGNGTVTIKKKLVVDGTVGIGVKNFESDVDITTAGPIRIQNKKFEVGPREPATGSYRKGDIMWNSDPRPSGFVGWICTREGTPGEWKPFGNIAS